MNNINLLKRWIKRSLKTKVSINHATMIAFLVTGLFYFNVTAYSDGAVLDTTHQSLRINTSDNSNREDDLYQAISVGWQAGKGAEGNHTFILGKDAAKESKGKYNFIFGEKSGNKIGDKGAQKETAYNFIFGEDAGNNLKENDDDNVFYFKKESDMKPFRSGNNFINGYKAGNSLKGAFNFVSGPYAGNELKGYLNFAFGKEAGEKLEGNNNFVFGEDTGKNLYGDSNIVLGSRAGINLGKEKNGENKLKTKSDNNVLLGSGTGANLVGSNVVAIGSGAGGDAGRNAAGAIVASVNSVFIGANSGIASVGEDNLYLGASAGRSAEGDSNVLLGKYSGNGIKGKRNIVIGEEANSTYRQSKIGASTNTDINRDENSGKVESNQDEYKKLSTEKAVEANDTIAFGYHATASKNNTIAIGLNAVNDQADSVALGSNSVVLDTDKLKEKVDGKITKGLEADYTSEDLTDLGINLENFAGKAIGLISVGDIGKERRIQNVAPGLISATSTDAINGSQLYSALSKAGSLTIFDSLRIETTDPQTVAANDEIKTTKLEFGKGLVAKKDESGTVLVTLKEDEGQNEKPKENPEAPKQDMPKNDKKEEDKAQPKQENINNAPAVVDNSGTASAIAIASLPQVAGKGHNVALSYGRYKGSQAVALGFTGTNKSGKLGYKASGSLTTKGDLGIGLGISYKFKEYTEENDIVLLQDKLNNLEQTVKIQGNQIKELKDSKDAQIKELKDQINKLYELITNKK